MVDYVGKASVSKETIGKIKAMGGLRMLMRTIAIEFAPYKITVNNIGPGAIYTPID